MDLKVFTVSSKAFYNQKLGLKQDETGKVSILDSKNICFMTHEARNTRLQI